MGGLTMTNDPTGAIKIIQKETRTATMEISIALRRTQEMSKIKDNSGKYFHSFVIKWLKVEMRLTIVNRPILCFVNIVVVLLKMLGIKFLWKRSRSVRSSQ